MIYKDAVIFPLAILAFLGITFLISGCDYSTDEDIAENQVSGCTKEGQHQAYCIYEKALASTNPEMCDKIDVDALSKAEKSPELRMNIPVIKDRCLFEVSIKAKNSERCRDIANRTHQYNSDICFFEIAQAKRDISLCLRVTPAGRLNPETNDVFNQASCISKLKAKLTIAGCGSKEQGDMTCVISYGVAKYNSDVCDEYFDSEQDEEGNLVCKSSVEELIDNIEKAALSGWANE